MSRNLSKAVKQVLVDDLQTSVLQGVRYHSGGGSKSLHSIDQKAGETVSEMLSEVNCDLYIESFPARLCERPDFIFYVDPVDGSLNWDRGVGDLCIAIAVTEKVQNPRFGDLCFAYTEGFRSGDHYYTSRAGANYFNALLNRELTISTSGTNEIEKATGYLRFGYGGAEIQLLGLYPLLLQAEDIRGIENTAIEICEVAKGAADFVAEARHYSEFYNLLAYPILRAAGGVAADLEGRSLEDIRIDPQACLDFSEPALLQNILKEISGFQASKQYRSSRATFQFNTR